MDKNATKIRDGIKRLAYQPHEVISGTVVEGTVDESACTVSVKPSGSDTLIEGVILNAVAEEGKGMLLFPKDGSHVIIASIDGPGEWVLVKASEITKAVITIGNVRYEMTDTRVSIENGNVAFDVGADVFKMNTSTESLYQLLDDLITAIKTITVTTPSGVSGTPLNVLVFDALSTRLGSLLSA